MKPPDRQRLALAAYISRQTQQLHPCPLGPLAISIQTMSALFQPLEQAARRLSWCSQRRLLATSGRQTDQVACLTRELVTQASSLLDMANTQARLAPTSVLAGMGDIYRDLLQLEDEFDAVAIDLKNHTLSVTTVPITLDHLYLGPFEIRLQLSELPNLRRRLVYRVIATEPHPASTNDLVTHPHVRDEELCEGDASSGIRHALESGRICDFFLLVRSVLENYNPGSPYVAIDDWQGTSCQDCGCSVSSDESYYCEGCQQDYCCDCIGRCQRCDDNRCSSCLQECHDCGESLCRRCQRECSGCGKITCSDCLEEDLCPACREKEEISHDPSDTESPNAGNAECISSEGPATTSGSASDEQAPRSEANGPDAAPAQAA